MTGPSVRTGGNLTPAVARARRVWPGFRLVAIVSLFALAGLVAFRLPPTLVVAALGTGAAVLGWLIAPEVVILTLVLVRSSVDGFMEFLTLSAGPVSMNLAGAFNSLAVGLGLVAVVRRAVRRQPLLVAGPGRAYTILLLVGLLSIPGVVDPVGGIKEWARLASGLAIYLMVADVVRDERGARRFTVAILVSSLIPIALAWLQSLQGSGYFFIGFVGTEFAYRPQGTFYHPAALGSYLVVLLTMVIGIYFSTTSAVERAALASWGVVAGGCLALTLARTQWLGMAAATLVIGLLKRRRLALVLAIAAVILLAAVPLLRDRLAASESVDWRLHLWQTGLQLAWPPQLLGWGLASSPWHINQLSPGLESPPHNDYLKVAIELGILGLLAYGLWLASLVRHAWRAYGRAENRAIAWRALSLFAVVLAGIVMSGSDNYLSYTAVQWYVWALAALIPANGRWPVRGEADV